MNKKIYVSLEWIKYSIMIVIIIMGIYIFFFDDARFCVKTTLDGVGDAPATITIDPEDEKRCFRTIDESLQYQRYLVDKYDIGEKEFVLNISE
jgi:hypothetical protein